MKTVDIIITNYNTTEYTKNCINSIYRTANNNINVNVIVEDNGSLDKPERLLNYFPGINLNLNKKNLGFSKAVNKAIKICSSNIIILLNPDTLILKGFFENAVSFMENNKDIGIVGPKIYNDDFSVQGSARSFPTPLTSLFGRESPLTKLYPNNSITKKNILISQCNKKIPSEVDWVSGACMIIRRETLSQIGLFDENFFLYWEDTDICKRSRDAGWKIVYCPILMIMHLGGKSSDSRPNFSILHFHRSCYYLFLKHTKGAMKIIAPIAFWGLFLRCIIVMISTNLSRIISRKHRKKYAFNRNKPNQNTLVNKRKIKILRVISRLNIGGPTIHISILLNKINRNFFDTKLISGSLSPSEGNMNYLVSKNNKELIHIPELQREIDFIKDIKSFFKLCKIVNVYKPDIVHTHMAKAGAIARVSVLFNNAISSKKIKTVHTYHGHVLEGYFGHQKSKIFKIIERYLAKFTDVIVAISNSQKSDLVDKYKIAPLNKILNINLGFNLNPFFNLQNYRGQLRNNLKITSDTILVGIIGRLVPIKNHKMFLNAAQIYIANQPYQNIKFLLVGDGELRNVLETYCIELGIRDHIFFWGWEHNISVIYADLDMLVLTSLNEGTPVSIIEAMAACVPVITTDVGGVRDLLGKIENEYDGFKICERGLLCPKDKAEILARCMNYSIINDYKHNSERTLKAQEFVLNNYSDTRLIREIESLYAKIMAST